MQTLQWRRARPDPRPAADGMPGDDGPDVRAQVTADVGKCWQRCLPRQRIRQAQESTASFPWRAVGVCTDRIGVLANDSQGCDKIRTPPATAAATRSAPAIRRSSPGSPAGWKRIRTSRPPQSAPATSTVGPGRRCMQYQSQPITRHETVPFSVWLRWDRRQ